MIVRRAVEGLDDRLDGSSFIARNLKKVFPDHWSFMLGELAMYSFVLLILTGTFLAFFYVASPDQMIYRGPYLPLQGRSVSLAYNSVLQLSFEVRAGLVMRQTHHWSALIFMAAIVAHMIRVFFTGAFRKPREMSWLMGVGLVTAGIGAGFTGYSLPDDLLSGVGLRIAYSIAQSIPFVGQWLANMFFGGEFPGDALLPRLLTLHIFVIPLVILAMMSTHLAVVWHQTHTQFKGPGRAEDTVTGTPVWPKFALKSVGLAFVTFATLTLMGGIFQINPVWFYGPYVSYTGPSPSQPDWYAGWLEGLLRLWPNWEFTIFGVTVGELFLPAIVVPGIMFTLLATWPFLEARFSKDHEWHNFAQKPREAPVRSALGAAAIGLMVVLFLAGSNDVLAKYLQIEVDTFNAVLKVLVFVLPVVVGFLTFMVCRDLRDRPRSPVERPGTMTVRRTEDGGFEEIHEPGTHDEVDAP
ncbi:MAG TPA: cytochrome bc complex cytochrome b subunit [Actinomycetota bacterium]